MNIPDGLPEKYHRRWLDWAAQRPSNEIEVMLMQDLAAECRERNEAYKQRTHHEQLTKANLLLIEQRANEHWVACNKAERRASMYKDERDVALAELPSYSGCDENRARVALGNVLRHSIGDHSASIGVVEVRQAMDALIFAYAENNALQEQLKHWRDHYQLKS